jgi:N-acetylmuramoyl-L-alanine amidase
MAALKGDIIMNVIFIIRKFFNGKPMKKILFAILIVIAICKLHSSPNPVISVFRHWAPLTGRVVVIDPGHGGIDGGTCHKDGTLEKDINLQVSLELKRLLEKNGVNVNMTRTKDIALDGLNNESSSRHRRDLLARVSIINKTDPDVFISIHVNAEKSPKVRGPMVFYYRKSQESKNLAMTIQKSVEHAYIKSGQKVPARSPLANSSLFLLCNTKRPGVIIEMGFLTNPDDKNLLKSKEFQKVFADAIVQGLKDYF